jgi:hypothetical protein
VTATRKASATSKALATATRKASPTAAASKTLAPTRKVYLYGKIDSIGGSLWVISGKNIRVDSKTRIWGTPKVGDWVWVEAYRQPDGSFLATKINMVWRARH